MTPSLPFVRAWGPPVWKCLCVSCLVSQGRRGGGGADVVWTTTTKHTQTHILVLSGGSSPAARICLDCIRLCSCYQLLKRQQSRAHVASCTHTCGFCKLEVWCFVGSNMVRRAVLQGLGVGVAPVGSKMGLEVPKWV